MKKTVYYRPTLSGKNLLRLGPYTLALKSIKHNQPVKCNSFASEDCLIIVTTIDKVALRTSSIAIISHFFLGLTIAFGHVSCLFG